MIRKKEGNKKKREKCFVKDLAKVDPQNVFLQTALVFSSMRTVGTALLRLLAALDFQMVLHVPQPAVFLAALRALEGARFLVEIAGRSLESLRIRVIRTARDFVLAGSFTIILTVTRPGRYHPL